MRDQHDRLRRELDHRREFAHGIDDLCAVQRRIDRHAGAHHRERVAVRRRARDERRADVAAGARPILDNDGLTDDRLDLGAHEPRQAVDSRTRGNATIRWTGFDG